MPAITPPGPSSTIATRLQSWAVAGTSLFFVLLQSVCTAVLSISALRVLIGVGSLAAAGGLLAPLKAIHGDIIRIPMLATAVVGSLLNLYVLQRIRTLRARPSSQWRKQAAAKNRDRSEAIQIFLAVVTLLLVIAEIVAHRIVQHRF